MSAQTTPSKIIASPEALKAQAERNSAALIEKEKDVALKISTILKDEGCIIDMPIQISQITGVRAMGWAVYSLDRFEKQ